MNKTQPQLKNGGQTLEWEILNTDNSIKIFKRNKLYLCVILIILFVLLFVYGSYANKLFDLWLILSFIIIITGFIYAKLYNLKAKKYLLNDDGVKITAGNKTREFKWEEFKSYSLTGGRSFSSDSGAGDFWPSIILDILSLFLDEDFGADKDNKFFYLNKAKGFSYDEKIITVKEKTEQVQKFLETKLNKK